MKIIAEGTKRIRLTQYDSAEALEKYLGNPHHEGNLISFKRIMELDEQEVFPHEFLQYLRDWSFHHYYIPEELGGKLSSYEEFMALGRVISRRDLTLSITDAHTFLGSVPIWIAGNEKQKESLASYIKAGKSACLAVTEKSHGSDLVANKLEAVRVGNSYYLSGEKWPINKATQTNMLAVLAKTKAESNSRSLSLFLINKDKLAKESIENTPKIKTLGIRGCDISGITFKESKLSENEIIGKEGEGLEITLKGFHITRTLCAGLSLGAADTALRTTLRFALKRKLYGDNVFAIAHARQTLVNSFLDILISDCVAIFTARALHIVPEQFSVWSAIIKYFVPTSTEKVINNLSVILGARYYLRESHDHGIYQKVVRDNSIISLFDGSTIVNLSALSLQLKHLGKRRFLKSREAFENVNKQIETIFTLEKGLPSVRYDKLDLFSKGDNTVLQGLPILLGKLEDIHKKEGNSWLTQEITAFVKIIFHQLEAIESEIANFPKISGHNLPPEYFELAKNYCRLHAASMCVYAWVYNRNILGGFFKEASWLVLCLSKILRSSNVLDGEKQKACNETVAEDLITLYQENKLFSVIPIQIEN